MSADDYERGWLETNRPTTGAVAERIDSINVAADPEAVEYFNRLQDDHGPTSQDIIDAYDADHSDDDDQEDHLESWRPIDLTDVLAGKYTALEPTILRRDDGKGLFYPGQVNGIHARDGVGKSWIALFAAAQELWDGHTVVWVDFEDPNPATIIERLRSLGFGDDTILAQFRYLSPKVPSGSEAIELLLQAVDDAVTLVVVDSIGEAFGLDGINENNDNEVTPWLRQVLRPIAQAGPAVLSIDHSTNANDDPLRPSGSKRKRAAVTGHQCAVEPVEPFTKDQGGSVRLRCAKDRHGNYAFKQLVASITITSADGRMAFEISAPSIVETDQPDQKLELASSAAVWAVKRLGPGPHSRNVIEAKMGDKIKGRHDIKRAGIDWATSTGQFTESVGERNARLFELSDELKNL